MNNLISIIVPVYNAEKTLEKCVDSLLNQNHRELEIILVNDGSKDNSLAMCRAFAEKDERIRVIRKTNGGAASARNVGINEATGEYLCFVDGDDKVEKNYVSHLWKTLTQANADIAVCGLYYWTKDTAGIVPIEAPGIYHRDAYQSRFISHWTCSLMTNKLFKRSTIDTVRFDTRSR